MQSTTYKHSFNFPPKERTLSGMYAHRKTEPTKRIYAAYDIVRDEEYEQAPLRAVVNPRCRLTLVFLCMGGVALLKSAALQKSPIVYYSNS